MFIGTDNEMNKVDPGRSLAKWEEHIWGSDIHQLVAMGESGNSVWQSFHFFQGKLENPDFNEKYLDVKCWQL